MCFQTIIALVHYNGRVINDELLSSRFVSEVSRYLEVNNFMAVKALKQTILNLFIASNGKSYTVDLCYRCPVKANDQLKISYRTVMIEDDDDVRFVIGYAKKYEPHVQLEVMAFIREYIETSADVIWEHLEKQLGDSLNIDKTQSERGSAI
ncbi:uncharacterized protein LOC108340008 [Vigna angularis]|uniref:uncharacterized protein LOC108339977 n=1 Tax=Phaseolus angularis TaxID=3914 RepID=UPI000809C3FD|nr:uncharacterized protein LOC108339977 [Vigna angularis]XP_017432727.1 uncharacterized protein LOC108340008 [Vigna angularis]